MIAYLSEEAERKEEEEATATATATASETASDLEELKHELETALGKERFERQLSMARSQRSRSRASGTTGDRASVAVRSGIGRVSTGWCRKALHVTFFR